jgi:hypothetical protein
LPCGVIQVDLFALRRRADHARQVAAVEAPVARAGGRSGRQTWGPA